MFRKVINIISTIILIFLIIVVIVLFIFRATDKTPSFFGYQVLSVKSGSMEPALEVGDVILVKETPAEEIKKGDIITYEGKYSDLSGKTITHRVVEEPTVIEGEYYFQTQGDVEGAALDPVISYSQVKGRFERKLDLLKKIYSFFFTPYGIITFVFVIIALFGYEMISLLISYKKLDEAEDDLYEPKQKKESSKRKKPKKTHFK